MPSLPWIPKFDKVCALELLQSSPPGWRRRRHRLLAIENSAPKTILWQLAAIPCPGSKSRAQSFKMKSSAWPGKIWAKKCENSNNTQLNLLTIKCLSYSVRKEKLHFWQGWKPKSWNFYRATTTIYALPKIGPNWFIAKYRLALSQQILCESQTPFKVNKRILRGMNWNGKWYLPFHERIPHSVVERNTPLLTRNLPFSTIDR